MADTTSAPDADGGSGDKVEEKDRLISGERPQTVSSRVPQPSRSQDLRRHVLEIFTHTEWGRELQTLLSVSLPIMTQGALSQLLNIADLFFVGNWLGPEYLAAAALGNSFFNMLSAAFLGVAQAVDDACSSSYSKGSPGSLGPHLQRGLSLMAVATLPMLAGISATDGVLVKLFGQRIELAETASGFVDSLTLGLLPLAFSTAVSRYLWAQGVVWPALAVDALSNILNVSLNALLINVDGFLGAPLATSVSRVAQLLLVTGYILRWRPHASRGTWTGWSLGTAVRDGREMASLGAAAVTGITRIAMETWPLEMSTLLAGRLDVPSLDAHTVVLNTTLFLSLMLPTGLGAAASQRIPRLLAAGDAKGAHRSAIVAVCAAAVFNCLAGLVLLSVRGHMGEIFTKDPEVTRAVADVSTIAALFQLLDGCQVSLGGVLKGVGYDKVVTAIVFAGWTVVALPVAGTLAVTYSMGLHGLWLGLLAGTTAVAVLYGILYHSIDWPGLARAASRLGHASASSGSDGASAGVSTARDAPPSDATNDEELGLELAKLIPASATAGAAASGPRHEPAARQAGTGTGTGSTASPALSRRTSITLDSAVVSSGTRQGSALRPRLSASSSASAGLPADGLGLAQGISGLKDTAVAVG